MAPLSTLGLRSLERSAFQHVLRVQDSPPKVFTLQVWVCVHRTGHSALGAVRALTSAQSLRVFPSADVLSPASCSSGVGWPPDLCSGGGWTCSGPAQGWQPRAHLVREGNLRGRAYPLLARGPDSRIPMPRPAPTASSLCTSGVWTLSVENRDAWGGCWGHLKTGDLMDGVKGQTRAWGWSAL